MSLVNQILESNQRVQTSDKAYSGATSTVKTSVAL